MPIVAGRRRILHPPLDEPFELKRNSPQAEGLVAWWLMLASRGTNSLRDLSGYDQTATFGAAGEPAWTVDAEYGSVLQFDGADDYVAVPQFVIGAGEPWTLFIRFYVSAWVSNNAGLWRGPGAANDDYISFRSDKIYIEDDAGVGHNLTGGDQSLGTWHDLAIVFTPTDILAYQAGKFFDNVGFALANALTINRLGEGYGGNAINGFISEARVYNRIVDAGTIWQMAHSPTMWDLCQPTRRYWMVHVPAGAGGVPVQMMHLARLRRQ